MTATIAQLASTGHTIGSLPEWNARGSQGLRFFADALSVCSNRLYLSASVSWSALIAGIWEPLPEDHCYVPAPYVPDPAP